MAHDNDPYQLRQKIVARNVDTGDDQFVGMADDWTHAMDMLAMVDMTPLLNADKSVACEITYEGDRLVATFVCAYEPEYA